MNPSQKQLFFIWINTPSWVFFLLVSYAPNVSWTHNLTPTSYLQGEEVPVELKLIGHIISI